MKVRAAERQVSHDCCCCGNMLNYLELNGPGPSLAASLSSFMVIRYYLPAGFYGDLLFITVMH